MDASSYYSRSFSNPRTQFFPPSHLPAPPPPTQPPLSAIILTPQNYSSPSSFTPPNHHRPLAARKLSILNAQPLSVTPYAPAQAHTQNRTPSLTNLTRNSGSRASGPKRPRSDETAEASANKRPRIATNQIERGTDSRLQLQRSSSPSPHGSPSMTNQNTELSLQHQNPQEHHAFFENMKIFNSKCRNLLRKLESTAQSATVRRPIAQTEIERLAFNNIKAMIQSFESNIQENNYICGLINAYENEYLKIANYLRNRSALNEEAMTEARKIREKYQNNFNFTSPKISIENCPEIQSMQQDVETLNFELKEKNKFYSKELKKLSDEIIDQYAKVMPNTIHISFEH